MLLGPIFRRELDVAAKRWGTFGDRCSVPCVVLLVIATAAVGSGLLGQDGGSIAGVREVAGKVFAFVVAVQALMVMARVPGAVAPALAGERDRKTLDAVLASGLTSAEVVLGALGGGLVRSLGGTAGVLPVMVVMVPLAGIDPRLVLLTVAGLAATAFVMGAISIAVSAVARDTRRALAGAILLTWGWVFLPIAIVVLLPRVWPAGARWVYPVAIRLVDSSPMGVIVNMAGLTRGGVIDAVARMIGYEMAGGVLLVAWAAARLRPASRAAAEGGGRAAWRGRSWWEWPRLRPPCGDDALLWKEMFVLRNVSLAARIDSFLTPPIFVGGLGIVAYWFARPAWFEAMDHRYGPGPGTTWDSTLVPSLIQRLATGAGPAPGQARAEFNVFLRLVTALLTVMDLLFLAQIAAEKVTLERERDTWLGLLATPLSGGEILRAKTVGAVWKARWTAGTILGLWSIGLMAGAVHPLGFLAAVLGLGILSWSHAALGTSVALWSRTRNQANNRVLVPLTLVAMTGLVFTIRTPGPVSILMGAGSVPCLASLWLLSYDDVRAAMGTGEFPSLAAMGVATGEGAARVLATYLIGLGAQAVAALLLTRSASRGFDAAVGRPARPGPDCRHTARPHRADSSSESRSEVSRQCC
jgi:ABC-type Na+ efflux pump permease subunit